MFPNFLFKFLHCFFIFFNCIPFVHNDNNCSASFMCIPSNFLILFNDPFFCINDNKTTSERSIARNARKDTIFFCTFIHFAFFPHPCCINDDIFMTIIRIGRINCIPCCSCNITDNNTVFS